MTPIETFEQEMNKHHEEFRQNVDRLNAEFSRDVKYIFLKGAILFVLLLAIVVFIASFFAPEGPGK